MNNTKAMLQLGLIDMEDLEEGMFAQTKRNELLK